jgi:uncharacterized membrane protein
MMKRPMMKHSTPLAGTALAAAFVAVMALPAHAACYADYKAKQDRPLRLHYGVMQISDGACGNGRAAAAEIGPRLSRAGWTLLTVLGTFGPDGLAGRKASAGEFYLRF